MGPSHLPSFGWVPCWCLTTCMNLHLCLPVPPGCLHSPAPRSYPGTLGARSHILGDSVPVPRFLCPTLLTSPPGHAFLPGCHGWESASPVFTWSHTWVRVGAFLPMNTFFPLGGCLATWVNIFRRDTLVCQVTFRCRWVPGCRCRPLGAYRVLGAAPPHHTGFATYWVVCHLPA